MPSIKNLLNDPQAQLGLINTCKKRLEGLIMLLEVAGDVAELPECKDTLLTAQDLLDLAIAFASSIEINDDNQNTDEVAFAKNLALARKTLVDCAAGVDKLIDK